LTWSLSKNLLRTSCFSLSFNSWATLHNSLLRLLAMVEHFLHFGTSLWISINIVVSKRVGELDFPTLLKASCFARSIWFFSWSCACLQGHMHKKSHHMNEWTKRIQLYKCQYTCLGQINEWKFLQSNVGVKKIP